MRTIKELSNLSGRVALITGGAGHIGGAMCETLAELYADIILLDFNQKKLEDKKAELELKLKFLNKKINLSTLHCDLELESDIEKVPGIIEKRFKKLDILINCAALVGTSGLEGWSAPLKSQSIKTWKKAVNINLTGAFYLTQLCLPLIENSKHGTIINIGSIYGISGMDMNLYEGMNYITPAAYAASKGGLAQLTKYLATALAPNIRVNMITSGGIERKQNHEFQKRYCKKTPLTRMGTEEDLKGAVAYLASELSSYVTGQNIIVDGGWSV